MNILTQRAIHKVKEAQEEPRAKVKKINKQMKRANNVQIIIKMESCNKKKEIRNIYRENKKTIKKI